MKGALLLSAVVALGLLGLVSADCNQIKIAVLVSLTGSERPNGLQGTAGVKYAFNDSSLSAPVNITGCPNPVPFNWTVYDQTSSNADATAAANAALADGANFVLSAGTSALLQATADVTEPAGIVHVNAGAASSVIYQTHPDYTFGLFSGAGVSANTSLALQMELAPNRRLKVALLWVNSSFGPDYYAGATSYVTAYPNNFELVVNQAFAPGDAGTPQWTAALDLINDIEGGVDVTLVAANLAEFLLIQAAVIQKCLKTAAIQYSSRGFEPTAVQQLGYAGLNGILSTQFWSSSQTDAASLAFKQGFTAFEAATNGGEVPNSIAAVTYLATRILLKAVRATATLEAQPVADYLAAINEPCLMPGGHLQFNDIHQATTPALIVQIDDQDVGHIVYTGPGTALPLRALAWVGCTLSSATTVTAGMALLVAVVAAFFF